MNLADDVRTAYSNVAAWAVLYSGAALIGSGVLHYNYNGEEWWHISGAAAALAGRLLHKISSAPVNELWNHPKIKQRHGNDPQEYPLLFSLAFPTTRQYFWISTALDVLIVGATLIFPPAGYAQAAIAPVTYQRNKALQKNLEAMIKEGKKE